MHKRPWVTIFSTVTVDGKIASKTGYSKLSCPSDLKRLHKLRALHDAVMVGANTIIMDNPRLTVRLVSGPQPKKIVVDGNLKVPPEALVFQNPRTFLITRDDAVDFAKNRYKNAIIIGSSLNNDGLLDLSRPLQILRENYGINRILVEGGGLLNWSLLKQGLVDEVRITISPYIFGGRDVCFVSGEGFDGLNQKVKLKLEHYELCECGNEIHIVYRIIRE